MTFYFRSTDKIAHPHKHAELLSPKTTHLAQTNTDRALSPEINAARKRLAEASELRFDGCMFMRGGQQTQTGFCNAQADIAAFRLSFKTDPSEADFHICDAVVPAPVSEFVIFPPGHGNFFMSTTKVLSKIFMAPHLFSNCGDMRLTFLVPRKQKLPNYFAAMVEMFFANTFREIQICETLDFDDFITPIEAIPSVFESPALSRDSVKMARRRKVGSGVRLMSDHVGGQSWADHSIDAPKRIIISRKKAKVRQIQNLLSWTPDLQRQGFEEVVMEEFSVPQQISMIRNADAVIGPHGAGMTHMAFARPETAFFELTSRQFIKRGVNNFAPIAEMKGITYHLICCNEAGDPFAKMEENQGNDLIVTDEAKGYVNEALKGL